MNLDPRHLAQLSVIVEAGSFQLAANRLGLTQPALSRNMAALEARLGAPLFQRAGRRSMPNELARRLARSGLAIRAAEEQASAYAVRAAAGAIGEIRIGAPPIVAGRFLTRATSQFLIENPSCAVELRVGLVHELRTMLERNDIDIVIGPLTLAEPSDVLAFAPLIDDRVGVLCRVNHPLCERGLISSADLEAQSWVAHSRGSLLRQQTESALIASGVHHIQIAFETDSIRSVLEIVADTNLITTMPKATTEPYLADRLVFLSFDSPRFHRPLGLIRRRDAPTGPTVEKFIKNFVGMISDATHHKKGS